MEVAPIIKPESVLASHLRTLFFKDGLTKAKKDLLRAIKNKIGFDSFDSIAFTGMSGALVVPLIAAELGKYMILCRKENDNTHSDCRVETNLSVKEYIIIDDFIDMGDTIQKIYQSVHNFSLTYEMNMKCKGIFLYGARNDTYEILNDKRVEAYACLPKISLDD